jgi:hypothetical protein
MAKNTKNNEPSTIPMSNSIATREGQVLAVRQAAGDDVFNDMASSGKYLPRLMMYGANSKLVKQGKIGMAHFGLVTGKDNVQDLGTDVDIVPVAWRPFALDTSGEELISVYDHADPEFKRIQAQSELPDSGCMFGPEFMVWVPTLKRFASLFMSSKTARREAPAIRERLGKPTTLGTEYIETKKFGWHGIVAKPCSTPFDLPDQAAVDEETEKFLNPPKNGVERAPEPSAAASARVR